MKYFSLARIKSEIRDSQASPQLTAFSLAFGVSLAFSPLPGMHLAIGFLITRLFRLNGILVILGILIHNPWTALPIHLSGLLVGDLLLYQDLVSLENFRSFPWKEIGPVTVFKGEFWHQNGSLLLLFVKPFIFGSLFNGSLLGLICYKLTLKACRIGKPPKKVKPTPPLAGRE